MRAHFLSLNVFQLLECETKDKLNENERMPFERQRASSYQSFANGTHTHTPTFIRIKTNEKGKQKQQAHRIYIFIKLMS